MTCSALKSNADHTESMRRRVGALGVLCDVIGRGTGSAWPDFNVFIVDKLFFVPLNRMLTMPSRCDDELVLYEYFVMSPGGAKTLHGPI